MLHEKINYLPDYIKYVQAFEASVMSNGHTLVEGAVEHCLRLRVEMQGCESHKFMSLLGRRNRVPGAHDKVDYMMMRRNKEAYYI